MCDHFERKTAGLSDQLKQILLIILGDYYLCPHCKKIKETEELSDGRKASSS